MGGGSGRKTEADRPPRLITVHGFDGSPAPRVACRELLVFAAVGVGVGDHEERHSE
jgi:hypothetical protein